MMTVARTWCRQLQMLSYKTPMNFLCNECKVIY